MITINKKGDFFAMDIGTNAVRVVQLASSGGNSWNLQRFGYVSVDERLTSSGSTEGKRRLGEAITTAVGQSGIKEKNVVIGLPSNKTFTTVIELSTMSDAELRSTIKYQADQYIPMAINEAKVDWALLGQSLHDPKQQEVLLASTSNAYSEEKLEFIESLGFNVIGAEPDSIAMIRSLLPSGISDARLIVDMGEVSTDIAITFSDAPRLVRTIPIGLRSIVKAAAHNLSVQDEQARQFILKFGLAPDKLDGQVYRSVESVLDNFATELVKSIKFFQTKYSNAPVGGMLLSGFTASIPQVGNYLAAKTNIAASIANPWQKVNVAQSDQQRLAPVANEFATAVGLAQRSGR